MTNGSTFAAAARRSHHPFSVQRCDRAVYVLQMSEQFFTRADTNASRAFYSNDFNMRDYWDEAAPHNYQSLCLRYGAMKPKRIQPITRKGGGSGVATVAGLRYARRAR